MNIKSKLFGFLMISILLLTSCQPGSLVEEENLAQPTSESVPTTTPLFLPTSIAIINTPDSELIPLERQCLTQVDTLLEQDRPVGNLVLAENSNGVNYFFLDLKSMIQKEATSNNDSLYDLTISPNHTLMLYFNSGSDPWINEITNLEGEIIQIPYSDEWASVAWLDNENLLFGRTGETPESTIRVYNYLTGEDNNVILDLPNPYYWLHPTGTYILIASINSDLTRVVFFDMQDDGRIIYWDNEASKMLASLPYLVSSDSWHVPAVPFFDGWSANGKQFITTSPIKISDSTGEVVVEELFRIDYDGQITQLTHLSDIYRFVRISGAVQSPDGETIAFWLEVSDDPDRSINTRSQQLVVLNNKTGELTDLCLSFGEPSYSSAASQPIWSPDGKYLIVETRTSGGDPTINLVNVESKKLFTLQDGLFPVGWVIHP